jgi:polyisoprenoid-binding protein YceI
LDTNWQQPFIEPKKEKVIMKRLLTAVSVVLILALPLLVSASDYRLDPDHYSIQFKIRHLTVSNVTGTFQRATGTATFDDRDPAASKVEATIDTASIDTGHAKRDEHLRGPDFFDVAKYPTITFVSRKVEKAGPGKMKIIGNLTMHGITREVTIDVEGPTPEIKDPWGNFRRGVSGTAKINRNDFGITWNKTMDTGGLIIGEEVSIYIDVEWIRK